MNKTLSSTKVHGIVLSGFLFLAVLLFYGLYYPHHLHFQEQFQLFLFDGGYITDILVNPGGLADLVGRFLTQFFLFAWVGAAIVAILFVCIFLLCWRMAQAGWFQGLSLLPAILVWAFFCDENALLVAIVALLLALAADWGLSAIRSKRLRLTLRIISAPLLYWMLGPVGIVCGGLGLISAVRSREKSEIWVALVAVLFMVLMPLLAQSITVLPLDGLYLSTHYHRYPEVFPQMLWLAAACALLVPLFPATSSNRILSTTIWVLMFIAGGWGVKMSYNRASEEVMSYDFMVRFQQWNRIVETANQKKPNNALSCATLNLALGMKGELLDRMFDYHQNGVAGLLPDFQRDPVVALFGSEIYYHLGLINTAQRHVFEAQEAILDFQKSGRCYKRLAETNLIVGNYEVARKYLLVLTKTIFYRAWAQETLALLYNEEAIGRHKEYGPLRASLPTQDSFFDQRQMSRMLVGLLEANANNRLAFEYLQAGALLTRSR